MFKKINIDLKYKVYCYFKLDMVKMEKFFFEVIVVGSGLSAKTTIVSLCLVQL